MEDRGNNRSENLRKIKEQKKGKYEDKDTGQFDSSVHRNKEDEEVMGSMAGTPRPVSGAPGTPPLYQPDQQGEAQTGHQASSALTTPLYPDLSWLQSEKTSPEMKDAFSPPKTRTGLPYGM